MNTFEYKGHKVEIREALGDEGFVKVSVDSEDLQGTFYNDASASKYAKLLIDIWEEVK